MVEKVKVTIEKQGEEITVSNSFGKKWTFTSNDASGMFCALVANSCYEFFQYFDGLDESFTMNLTVSYDGQ